MNWIKRHKWLSTFLVTALILTVTLGAIRVDASVPLMAIGGLFLLLWFVTRKPVAKPARVVARRSWLKEHKFWSSVIVVFVLLVSTSWSSVMAGDFSRIAYITGLYVIVGLVVKWILSKNVKTKEVK